eukprot:Lithocolla_globosa_v1_NODE_3642_length_1618_cov_2.451056.p1 type:complete len:156 gc:universal NODE_3642_length_1618_cov_2.451056:743-276(-)
MSKIMETQVVDRATKSNYYQTLNQRGTILATYVWIDGSLESMRCKTMTLPKKPKGYKVSELKTWNFDGSSTGQAPGDNSDVLMKPCAIFYDPFRGGDNILVLTETLNNDGTPHETNHRHNATEIMDKVKQHRPWFGIEQVSCFLFVFILFLVFYF